MAIKELRELKKFPPGVSEIRAPDGITETSIYTLQKRGLVL